MTDPTNILRTYWGFEDFKELQLDIIDSVLKGQNTIALLSTGGGKSICFQIPGLILDGITLVITPLIALMIDQLNELKKRKIKAVAIHGGLSSREIDILLDNCVYGMPSVDPKHKKFESERYWRGPVWSIMNYMISYGLENEGEYSLAKRIKDDTIKLIEVGGMYEYFNPHTGKGLGGHDFSWTAAILLAFGRDSSNLKFTNN